ncbi:hypothetical protein GUJ93_ZPchr0012g20917 [Zizania palustris]|uniref:Uncharacterized protein n=1 Tax=Zizania palustris TaxID=103762 RepID=A0A8J5WUF7_ZIZPA|nr:hypothetical protein GUJ93_ZPchr0012g20917 [Zizania palustris]
MAAAFRSAGRGRDAFAAAEDAGSATRGRGVRRSRSLSRFPPPSPSPEDAATPSSRFVNKFRGGGGRGGGGGLPEISLDDLADEFFRARAESEDDDEVVVRGEEARGRLRFPAPAEKGGGWRSSTARYARETESSRQRERSVSRPPADRRGGATTMENGRRRQYASVDQHRWCDSDNDIGISHRYGSRGINTKSSTGNGLQNSFHMPANVNQSLKRSTSQKDFLHSRDSSSSHSSLTDDEYRDTQSFNNRNQIGIQDCPVGNDDENILYDVMRKEVRNVVEEIRTQLEKVVIKSEPSEKATGAGAQPTQVITELRRSYTSKLEESEKRKQELQPRYRRRSNDRAKMSRRLTEEAEKYFEDFLSNVEDTDLSSFDGERSDTSSSRKDVMVLSFPGCNGETSNDLQTSPCKSKTQGASTACSSSSQTMSSRGSWSPGDLDSSVGSKDRLLTRFEEVGTRRSSCPGNTQTSSFHLDDYMHLLRSHDLLLERWRQKQRIEDGGLILCSRSTIM